MKIGLVFIIQHLQIFKIHALKGFHSIVRLSGNSSSSQFSLLKQLRQRIAVPRLKNTNWELWFLLIIYLIYIHKATCGSVSPSEINASPKGLASLGPETLVLLYFSESVSSISFCNWSKLAAHYSFT